MQAVEHYEIARYGAMVSFAKQLGLTQAVEMLQQTLEEEKASDGALNQLAEGMINPQANEEESDKSEEDEKEEDAEPDESKGIDQEKGKKPKSKK